MKPVAQRPTWSSMRAMTRALITRSGPVHYDLVPIGTKVTVVNQPYLFGSRDGTLYLQAYAVMEDDSRDWNKNRKRLLGNMLGSKLLEKVSVQSIDTM